MRILYFSPINWDDLKQRPQHIAEELSKEHTVFFIEPSISILSSFWHKSNSYTKKTIHVNNNLIVIRPSGALRMPRCIELFDIFGANIWSETLQLSNLLKQIEIVWLGSPLYFPLANKAKDKKLIYDKMDDYVELTTSIMLKQVLANYEKKLIKKANKILISSSTFREGPLITNQNVYLVNNGIDTRCLNSSSNHELINNIQSLREQGQVVFGYVGTVDHWFDYEIIRVILDSCERHNVFIIGKDNLITQRIDHPRLTYVDPISKEDLYPTIRTFNYGLYPFKRSKFLNTINPVKIYDYLCCNIPTIAIRTKETERFLTKVSLYNCIEEFNEILTNLNMVKVPFENQNELSAFISENSWSNRVNVINTIISNG